MDNIREKILQNSKVLNELNKEIVLRNHYNDFAIKTLKEIAPKFTSFVGRKIYLANGSKAKAFDINTEVEAPVINDFGKIYFSTQCYVVLKYKCLELVVELQIHGDDNGGWYKNFKNSIAIGDVKDGQTLDSLRDIDNIIDSYGFNNKQTFEEQLELIITYKEFEDKARQAKRAIKVQPEFYTYL